MKNRAFFILMSVIAILVLAACGSSPPAQSGISTPMTKPTPTSESASTQSSTQQVFVSISSTSTQDSSSIKVHTLPGAEITIELTYCGHSTKETKHADSAGDYTLNWRPDTKCGGMASATVTASSNGQSATSSTSFSVS